MCEILKTVDKAEFNSSQTFVRKTKELGALNKSMLSTGTKTLINIIQHPEICFNVEECGNNALQFITRIYQGIILWQSPFLAYYGNKECDIVYHGKSFNDFYEFLDCVTEGFK